MSEKIPSEISLKNIIILMLHSCEQKISESAPSVSRSDCSLLAYETMGYRLGKCAYFGLTFPLEDGTDLDELKALSNGYIEVKDGVVKMGVLKLENLEKILRAPYIKPRSAHIS